MSRLAWRAFCPNLGCHETKLWRFGAFRLRGSVFPSDHVAMCGVYISLSSFIWDDPLILVLRTSSPIFAARLGTCSRFFTHLAGSLLGPLANLFCWQRVEVLVPAPVPCGARPARHRYRHRDQHRHCTNTSAGTSTAPAPRHQVPAPAPSLSANKERSRDPELSKSEPAKRG